jgi:hypothetical protein
VHYERARRDVSVAKAAIDTLGAGVYAEGAQGSDQRAHTERCVLNHRPGLVVMCDGAGRQIRLVAM